MVLLHVIFGLAAYPVFIAIADWSWKGGRYVIIAKKSGNRLFLEKFDSRWRRGFRDVSLRKEGHEVLYSINYRPEIRGDVFSELLPWITAIAWIIIGILWGFALGFPILGEEDGYNVHSSLEQLAGLYMFAWMIAMPLLAFSGYHKKAKEEIQRHHELKDWYYAEFAEALVGAHAE